MPDIPPTLAPAVHVLFDVGKALVFLLVGWLVIGRVSAFVRNRVQRSRRVDQTLGLFLANTVHYVLMAAVAIAVLQTFGFQVTSLVAMLGAATLAIGLALQGTLSHVAAGLMVLVFRPYKIGDSILIATQSGTVSDLNLYLTELTAADGTRIYVPNGQAWSGAIVNYSVSPLRRCDITFAIDYGEDLDRAFATIMAVVSAEPRFLARPAPPWIGVVDLAPSSVSVQLRAWCRAEEIGDVRVATLKAAKEALQVAGIPIAYPTSVSINRQAA